MIVTYTEALALLGFSSDLQGALPPADAIRRAFRQQALLWHPDKHAASCSSGTRPAASPGPTAGPAAAAATAAAPPSLSPSPSATQSPSKAADDVAASAAAAAAGNGGGDAGSEALRNHHQHRSQAQATEHFKRLAAAYHLLLRATATGATFAGLSGDVMGFAAGGGEGGTGGEVDVEDEELLDELSVELLLLEANKMRLSDFDMVFLHQRAGGGGPVAASAASSVWPEAAQSVDDVWRRIRRRVERRRKRREGANGGGGADPGGCAGVGGGRPAVGAKWALLSEFLADVIGASSSTAAPAPPQSPPGEPERPGTPSCRAGGGAARAADLADEPASAIDEYSVSGGVVVTALPAPPARDRPHGRLPPGFYWRWLKRLVAARLLFYVFFKG